MALLNAYPLITVARLRDSRNFFVDRLDMRVVFEASWVVMLGHRDDGSIDVGLLSSDHPSSPPGPETFDGKGMIMTLQVDDAIAVHQRLASAGVPIVHPITVAPWGQRRFMVRDPSGVLVDVVEQVEPAPGFWERYSV
jgi:catechol 2,3-dioxygenase-like lactoylglutathione lyase family enzyme